ncbi:hypothetical protein DFH06DRAFT_1485487 [Mycena polygramma]|nr:hypothetical protein DFH06DRAFT_1485487 [Mycena polygramma]
MFQTTFLTLAVAALAIAGPTHTVLPRDDGLATFCFSDDSCFQAAASADSGCVDLPLFNDSFQTASLSAPGLECLLSPERGCVGSNLPGILLDTAGTVELSSLGLNTVASFLCTPDADLLNLCFPDVTQGCYQATTVTNGCSNLPRFGDAFASTLLTTPGTKCTLFDQPDCAGDSAVLAEALITTELSSLGLSNVQSFSC